MLSLGLLALLGVVATVYLSRRDRGPREGASARPELTTAPHEHEFSAVIELSDPQPAPTLDDSYPAELFSEARFEGTGRLELYVFARGGAAFPEHWSLVLEPSKVLFGGEHAVSRSYSFDHGERKFLIEDLPLGGYDLRAFAPGLNAPVQNVLLAKPLETHTVVHVEFHAAGFIRGRVLDTHGAAIEGLEMTLEASVSRERLTARTDPAGVYVFDAVLDGEYALFAGSPDSPLAPGKELAFLAPSLHFADILLAPLGELAIQVVDSRGAPVAGVRVDGYGSAGGRVALVTDEQGRGLARHIPAGDATLIATTDDARQGRQKLKLAAGERAEVTLRLRE